MVHAVLSLAKKEFMDNCRNKWIIVISAIFVISTLLASYFGSHGQAGWRNLRVTIGVMSFFVVLLITIIGLMLGYAAIVGEKERGSLGLLIALPLTRNEILLGKFLGLGAVLSTAILIGFGVSGIIISLNIENAAWMNYLIFIGASLLLGLVYLAIALFISSFFNKRSTAMGSAIFLWFFFNIIWILFIGPALLFFIGLENPDLYYAINIVNPTAAYSGLIELSVSPAVSPAVEMGGRNGPSYPFFYNSGVMVTVLLAWIIISLALSLWFFKRKDI